MKKSQTQNHAQQCSVYIQKGEYTFIITKQIIQKTGKSIEEITTYIEKGDFTTDYNKHHILNTQEHKILLMCMIKNRNQMSAFSRFIQDQNKLSCHISIEKQLAHIYFQSISYLNLYNCNINNLQDLQFLNAPTLTTFQLFGNFLVRIQSIFKNTNIKNLATLTLYKNKIKQAKNFSRALFPKLNYMELQPSTQLETAIEDLNFVFKLQGTKRSENSFQIWGSSRIINQKYRQIGLKYS